MSPVQDHMWAMEQAGKLLAFLSLREQVREPVAGPVIRVVALAATAPSREAVSIGGWGRRVHGCGWSGSRGTPANHRL